MRVVSALSLSLLVVAMLACGRAEETPPAPQAQPQVSAPPPASALPARVGAIELGSAIGPDGRVTAARSVFSPSDTIYASVLTEGEAAGASLSVRWTYQDGQLVSEGRETLAASGLSATEFHIAKPDGWPAGRYRVEIALNGQPAGAREFEVR